MPSLAEFAAVNAPIQLDFDGTALEIRNRYHTLSTDHLRFVAITEVDGFSRTEVEVSVPPWSPPVVPRCLYPPRRCAPPVLARPG